MPKLSGGGGGGSFPTSPQILTSKASPYSYPTAPRAAISAPASRNVTPITPQSSVAPAPAPAPAPFSQNFLGGGGGSGFTLPDAPAAPPQVNIEDYLASGADSAYTAQMAALTKALENSQADLTAQRGQYDVNYGDSVKNLGYNQAIPDDPATSQNEAMTGGWNFTDTNNAAGRGFQNQQNDFAGRGMLQSSLYGTAQDNLTRSLSDQLAGMNTAKQNFGSDIARQGAAFGNQNTLSQGQAKAEAIARRANIAQSAF